MTSKKLAYRTASYLAPDDLYVTVDVCARCGAIVHDITVHDEWHSGLHTHRRSGPPPQTRRHRRRLRRLRARLERHTKPGLKPITPPTRRTNDRRT